MNNKNTNFSEIIKNLNKTELIKSDKLLYDTVMESFNKKFKTEFITDFWNWFEKINISDANTIGNYSIGSYIDMIEGLYFVVKYICNDKYFQQDQEIYTSSDVIEKLGDQAVFHYSIINNYIDSIRNDLQKDEIFEISKLTKDNIYTTINPTYKKSFVEKILLTNTENIKIGDFLSFLKNIGQFDQKNYYYSDLMGSEYYSEISQIYEMLDLESGFELESNLFDNIYLYNFCLGFFTNNSYVLFDMFIKNNNDNLNLEDTKFAIKNLKEFIKTTFNNDPSIYIFLKINDNCGQIINRKFFALIHTINIYEFIVSRITNICNSMNRDVDVADNIFFHTNNIPNLNPENEDIYYSVKISVNQEGKFCIFYYYNDLSQQICTNIATFLYQFDEELLGEVIKYFGINNDIYDAISMPKEKINYNL